jgi:Ca2+-binding RTX toxin-like protein
MQIDGTGAADNLQGTEGDDVINGFGGFDQINGRGGNDVIDGGADGDSIEGGTGDDLIDGGDGSDFISDFGSGSDTVRGGAGADSINVGHYTASATLENLIIDAGSGDDRVTFNSVARGTASITLGDGADSVSLGLVTNTALTITTGAGRDTITLQQFASFGSAPTLTDFALGDMGDVLDIGEYLARNAPGWDGSNPFGANGYLRLVQSDTNALLQFDRDGMAATASSFATLVRFENVEASAFTAANLGGYAPSGSPVQGATITGSANSDILTGTVGADVISGLGGFDQIDGRNGNDVIDGGADSDNIQGGFGDDIVDGGDGDDFISDNGGSDTLRGGAGNDSITVSHSSSGSSLSAETIRVEGGTGDDRVGYFVFTTGSGTIDLGEGADRLLLGNGPGAVHATLGTGRDRVELSSFAALNAIPAISDFASGAGGDIIEITPSFTSGFQNWNGSNPFGTSGYLRLVQAGTDTLFQIDRDGAAGRTVGFQTLARLEGVSAATLTAENFSGYVPTFVNAADLATAFVSAPSLVTEGADRSFTLSLTLKTVGSVSTAVTMSFLADQSSATNGTDVNIGSFSGTYSVTQSPAADYQINLGTIAVLDDTVVEGDETIAIRITATGQTFETGTDSIVVQVKLRSDDPTGTTGPDALIGTAGSDVLRGLQGADTLSGLEGRDLLEGGEGNDQLSGGAEGDVFLFAGGTLGNDRISDFGLNDVLVTTLRIADNNRDGIIAFGSDRDLDFTAGGQAVITTNTGSRLTSLEFDGSFEANGLIYFVYSRVGSAVGVSDADLLI